MRSNKFLFSFIFSMLLILTACSASSQDPSKKIVTFNTPLSQPDNYSSASLEPFSDANPLGSKYNKENDFIFKGKINKISEVNVSWKVISEKETKPRDEWFSVCEVAINNILYGSIPGIKDTIKVIFWQTTRMLDNNAFRILEGQEYYFITHIFNTKDKTRETDPIQVYQYGDVMGGTFYLLFPVNDGVVSTYQGWTFEGSKPPAVDDINRIEGIASTIDEQSFLTQFTEMINEAKSKLDLEPTSAVETTSAPTDSTATSVEPTSTPDVTPTLAIETTAAPTESTATPIEPSSTPDVTAISDETRTSTAIPIDWMRAL